MKYLMVLILLLVSGCGVKCIGEPEAMINERYRHNKIISWEAKQVNYLYEYKYKILTPNDVVHMSFRCKGKYSGCKEIE